jgi:hypothetical protein
MVREAIGHPQCCLTCQLEPVAVEV